jgi:D-arabinose 1-dehydrogenase-like Zn-dependent alcohol dehydrogenase
LNFAQKAIDFAGQGAVSAHFSWDTIENINDVFAQMQAGRIDGRIVLNLN